MASIYPSFQTYRDFYRTRHSILNNDSKQGSTSWSEIFFSLVVVTSEISGPREYQNLGSNFTRTNEENFGPSGALIPGSKYQGIFFFIKILSKTYITICAFNADQALTCINTGPIVWTIHIFTA